MLQLPNKIFKSLLLAALVFALTSRSVQAKTLVFQDDFSGGFLKWESTRTNSEFWEVGEDGAATAYVPYSGAVVEMVPKNEYWNSSWTNIDYEFDFVSYQGIDRNMGFGYQDNRNWYELHFQENGYYVTKVRDGSVPMEIYHEYKLVNGQTYHMVITLAQGVIKVTINDQLISQDQDPTFNNNYGKVTIKASTGSVAPTKVSFDNIKVYFLSDEDMIDYHFKQSDPLWAESEYDTASTWSPEDPSMKRWGCAVSSMAMIMRYYGIKTMPGGEPVNPLTLNDWLKNQTDGYLGDGLVNWQAAARLTQLISQTAGTPTLEYKYLSKDELDLVNQDLNNQQPVIINIPDHFLLAEKLTTDNNDWQIYDPYYDFSLFSQHQKEALSFRQFTPSHTDLSYLLIAHDPNVSIQIFDANQQQLSTTDYIETLTPEYGNSQSQSIGVTQLTKPSSQNYLINIQSDKPASTPLTFYQYDQSGHVNIVKQELATTSQPTQLNINFDKQEVSHNQISPTPLNFQSWSNYLEPLYQNQQIKEKYAVILLANAAAKAQDNPPETHPKFIKYIEAMIKWLSPTMTGQTKDLLIQELHRVPVL